MKKKKKKKQNLPPPSYLLQPLTSISLSLHKTKSLATVLNPRLPNLSISFNGNLNGTDTHPRRLPIHQAILKLPQNSLPRSPAENFHVISPIPEADEQREQERVRFEGGGREGGGDRFGDNKLCSGGDGGREAGDCHELRGAEDNSVRCGIYESWGFVGGADCQETGCG